MNEGYVLADSISAILGKTSVANEFIIGFGIINFCIALFVALIGLIIKKLKKHS